MASLNPGQQKTFLEMVNFINDDTQQFMDVDGGPGTGKTFLISKTADGILDHKKPGSPLHTVGITATTNKAAAVLADAMPHRAGEIGTIYSFMNLRLKENWNTGETSVVPVEKAWVIHSGMVIIVDEDSMINKDLFKWLVAGIDSTCKVIFVGDRDQLAPVKEAISPIFEQGYKSSRLTQPVRNAEQPALMDLCKQLRETVKTGIFTPIVEVPGVIDFITGAELQGVLQREFFEENPNKRVLSYTNSRVIDYNLYIRQLRGYVNPFEVGEIVSNNQSAELPGKERLYTDQVVRVKKILVDEESDTLIKGIPLRMVTMVVEDVMSKFTYEVTSFANPDDRKNAMKYFADRNNWSKYFNIKNKFPDLRSVAASTTHKAQGSTYDIVIVDLADIGKCTNSDQTARMQYVAMSRPKTRLYIRGKLPDRYFE